MRHVLTAGALALAAAGLFAAADTNTTADPATAPKGFDALVARVKKVGRFGGGNADAAKAWKELVALGRPALLPLLGTISDDDLTASNWLRPAFEAVAEKEQQTGKLPAKGLEAFATNRKNGASARRLAYEWLVKADKSAADRLLPKMLDDPAPELRRDAVAKVIKEADALAEKKEEKGAVTAYQKALKAAGDPEQVDAIAAALKKLGVTVDLPTHYGFVTRWHLAGPFEHTGGTGWGVAYEPEKNVNLNDSYKGKDGKLVKWSPFTTDDPRGQVDLVKAVGPIKGAITYAHAELDSPAERPVELRVGCINGLKVFLNGAEVFANEEYHHGMRIDQYTARGTLRKGKNVILLKVCQNEQKEQWAQTWRFQLRVCDQVGAGVPFTQQALAPNPAPATKPDTEKKKQKEEK